ncbi:hypothetical protein [Flavobacterium caseinilyticum]|uniref:Uncharacterized protein n=1 Tax=Flavobacterium caseinilyticum TaxID=2541732 RepID=A0A4R5B2Q4_9FLAO|nr:hypothetical protein [Flavobacterium caseinilyticum]TDD78446.1 hypothetical protein E0F89_02085 [Flavobacterium caseinilyticum]
MTLVCGSVKIKVCYKIVCVHERDAPASWGYDNSDYPTEDTYTENYQQYITVPILSAENSFDVKNTLIFYNSLSFQQQQWAIDNPNSYNQIIQYQIDNKWSDESKEFSNQIITPLSGDSSLKIDIESSF